MKRRQFLIGCGAGAALLASSKWRLLGAPLFPLLDPKDEHTFVLVFLRGGCDGLQLLAPFSDANYQDARPNSLKVGENEGYRIDQQYMNTGFGFHPEAGALKDLYDNGDLAIIHACGLANGTRSHFDAMDIIERGLNEKTSVHTGWMARYLNSINSSSYLPAISANSQLAEAFNGYGKASSIQNLGEYNLNRGSSMYHISSSQCILVILLWVIKHCRLWKPLTFYKAI